MTNLFAGEPAAWADLGFYSELRGRSRSGGKWIWRKRQKLAPENGAIEGLSGLLESHRGRYAEAIAHFRRAVALNPNDLKSRFSLLHELERLGEPGSEAEALLVAGELVDRAPANVPALLEHARLAAKGNDGKAAPPKPPPRLSKLRSSWPRDAQQRFDDLEQDVRSNPAAVARRILQLRNLLVQTPGFRKNLAAVETPLAMVGEPITKFLRLAPPPPTPSPPDEMISYVVSDLEKTNPDRCDAVIAVPLSAGEPPVVFVASDRGVHRVGAQVMLPFPGNPASPAPAHGILAVDWNSDYRMDFVFAGAGGLRVYLQKDNQEFADVTAATGLDAGTLSTENNGVWAADIEMDGDLDLVLGSAGDTKVTVLRNNGDGTFKAIQPFEESTGLRDFVWADLDQDGDPDAALLDAHGALLIHTNERAGRFQPRRAPDGQGNILALAVADLFSDGTIDLLLLGEGGTITSVTDVDAGKSWSVASASRPLRVRLQASPVSSWPISTTTAQST